MHNGKIERAEGVCGAPAHDTRRIVLMPRKYTPEQCDAAFWARVDKSGECWLWMGSRNTKGYGHLTRLGRWWIAPRLSWHLTYGPIGDGLMVCHACDNPPCVRPDHLFLGTNRDNMLDAKRKGRLYGGPLPLKICKRGHEMIAENTYVSPQGKRYCRSCRDAYYPQWYARKVRN